MKLIKTVAYKLSVVFCFMLIGWIALSWFEVVTQNTEPNPLYSPYNAIEVMSRLAGVQND